MKLNRTIAAACAISILSCGAVFAEYDPNKVVTGAEFATKALDRIAISIDGKYIDAPEVKNVDGVTVLPLRAVAEALGYKVVWNNEGQRVELTHGAHYITIAIGDDAYTFAKTAPMQLGLAPQLINDFTYVPDKFVSEVLQLNFEVNDGVFEIVTPEEVNGNAVISEITDEEILVTDDEIGEVRLVLGEESVIENANGEKLAADALKVGLRVAVEYSEAMTKSIPPLNNPVKITVYDEADASEQEPIVGKAEIVEITDEGFLINDSEQGEIRIVIGDETVIKDADGKTLTAKDLKVGQKLTVTYSSAMTLSLPPLNCPIEIIAE